MKKILPLALLILLLTTTGCEVMKNIFGKKNPTPPSGQDDNKVLVDSLVQIRLTNYLKDRFKADIKSTYTHPESRYIYASGNELKDEIEDLLGAILVVSKDTDSLHYFEESGYYVLDKNAVIETEIKTDKPYFDNIVEKNFSSNVDLFNTVTSQLTATKKAHTAYKKIRFAKVNPKYINILKADSIITNKLSTMFPQSEGFLIVRSVDLNNLSYSFFTEIDSDAQVTGTGFGVGAKFYQKSGVENNTFDIVLKGYSRRKTMSTTKSTGSINLEITKDLDFNDLKFVPKSTQEK
jgi:hypothetical protein